MSIYYNPVTREFSKAYLANICLADMNDPFTKLYAKRAYKSKEDAIAANISGFVHFYEADKLYRANSTGSWDCHPVTETNQPVHHSGINWGTNYYTTREAAEAFAKTCHQRNDISYSEIGDVWSVHYHY